jgi:hypothetical protein
MTRLPPHNAARRVSCSGSRYLESLYPQEQSPQRVEGRLAHDVAADMLRDEVQPWAEITDEILDGAKMYREFILAVTNGATLHIEEPLDISVINPECQGIPDCWSMLPIGDLHIFEYKYGHRFVEVFENWQLLEYAAGILSLLNVDGFQEQYITVHMHIIQPRSYHRDGHTRTWSETAANLRSYFNILRGTESEALSDTANCRISSECGNCNARHVCPTLQAAALSGVDISYSAIPHNLKPVEVATELKVLEHAAEAIKHRMTGLQAEALSLIQAGHSLPYYHVETTQGRKTWSKSAAEIIAVGEMLDVPLAKPVEVITPNQALAAGLPQSVIDKYSTRYMSEPKLVQTDINKIRKIFS